MKRTAQCLLVLTAAAGLGSNRAAAEVRLGINPRLSATEMSTMFTPLADHLSRETGEKVTLVIPKDFEALKALAASGQIDLVYANPLQYVQLRRDAGVEPLAVASEPKVGTRFRGVIVARKDSGIASVQDLKGKKLIFVDQDSVAAYMFPIRLLEKAGLQADRDFTVLPFAKKQDNVLMAVFNKVADAGAVREPDLERMKDKVDMSQIRIVGYTESMPNWLVFAVAKTSKAMQDKAKAALLKLGPSSGAADAVLAVARLNGFAPVADREFDQLREAAKAVGAF